MALDPPHVQSLIRVFLSNRKNILQLNEKFKTGFINIKDYKLEICTSLDKCKNAELTLSQNGHLTVLAKYLRSAIKDGG